MAKKQSAAEAAAEAAKKRRPQKKTAAPKAGAKKPAARPGKQAAPARQAAPAKKPPAKKPREASAQAELPITHVVEEAEILDETPVELAAAPHTAAGDSDAEDDVEEIVTVDDQPPTLSAEEQELSQLYGEDL